MAQTVEADTELYTIEWDGDIDTVTFTWDAFASGDQFKSGANALLEYVESNDVAKVIHDTSGIQAHDDEDLEWLEAEWYPKMVDAGLRYSAIVHQESVISQMDTEDFVEDVKDMPYKLMHTADLEEAREWMAAN